MKNSKKSLPSGAVVFASKSILVMLMCKKKKTTKRQSYPHCQSQLCFVGKGKNVILLI
jgi:hypothetical protein